MSGGLARRILTWGALIKFSHSVFALPFAVIMMVVVHRMKPISLGQVGWMLVCIVAARTCAMAFNRVIDAEIDGTNPRTRGREIPSGVVSRTEAWLLVLMSGAIFVAGAAALGNHCAILAPAVLGVLLGYSYIKRFSSWCHVILGVALALAPGGVWYALTAEWAWQPVTLMMAVMFWVAGFDILYSCQDLEFDRMRGLFSIPSRLGVQGAQKCSFVFHLAALGWLSSFGVVFSLGGMFWLGVGLFGLLLISQHVSVWRKGIGCVDQVFFTRNGIASIVLFLSVLLDSYWKV